MSKDGLRECLKYSLPPNSLSYCGPGNLNEALEYHKMGRADLGLVEHLGQHHTLYAYLSFIAYENDIHEPFDPRVVKAYWIGNDLLTKFDAQRFYYHLRDTLKLKRRLNRKQLEILFGKIPQGALPHHAFHVLNVPWRTGHLPIEHTLETMDSCRIGWGEVLERKNGKLIVETEPLVYRDRTLQLGESERKNIVCSIENIELSESIKSRDWVSFHWGMVCNKITAEEAASLRYYTQLAINLANKDIRRREHFG